LAVAAISVVIVIALVALTTLLSFFIELFLAQQFSDDETGRDCIRVVVVKLFQRDLQ